MVVKKFRKRISDLKKTGRVGPYDKAEEEIPTATTIDTSNKKQQPKDRKDVFGSIVSKVLNDGKEAEEGGFLGGYSLKDQKAEARAKRRLDKKRVKRKRGFEVEGGVGYVSESSESEASEDEAVKRRKASDRKILRKHILSQSHNREIPSLVAPDYEKRLRRVATNGVVRLFNAVAGAQNKPAAPKSDAKKSETSSGPPKEAVTRSKFLEMLKKGSDSKHVQKTEDTAAKEKALAEQPIKKVRHKKK